MIKEIKTAMASLDLSSLKQWPSGHVGYIALIGRPNTGKSTFLNALLDYHLCAVSSKPQTTRRNWMGIYSDDDSQLLFLDCPGVHLGKNKLDKAMDSSIQKGLEEADLVLFLFDATRPHGGEDQLVLDYANQIYGQKPFFVIVNKLDIATEEQKVETDSFLEGHFPLAKRFKISALKQEGTAELLQAIKEELPISPFLYSPETITDAVERQIAQDLIREAILESLAKEVPHCATVVIENYDEREKATHIQAVLHVETEGQKKIVIGKGGEQLDNIKRLAIKKLREIIDLPVRLKIYVKINPGWRDNNQKLKELEIIDRYDPI